MIGERMKNETMQKFLFAISLAVFLGGVFAGGVYAANAAKMKDGELRIPTKADTDSENNRTPIPIQIGQFSERSDALGLVIKKCPK
jgi:hypothetical protein